jgi:hypothetical protein
VNSLQLDVITVDLVQQAIFEQRLIEDLGKEGCVWVLNIKSHGTISKKFK